MKCHGRKDLKVWNQTLKFTKFIVWSFLSILTGRSRKAKTEGAIFSLSCSYNQLYLAPSPLCREAQTETLSVVKATFKEQRLQTNGKCSHFCSPLRRPSCTLPLMLSPMNVGTLSFLSMTHTSTVKPCRCAVVLKDTWRRRTSASTHRAAKERAQQPFFLE